MKKLTIAVLLVALMTLLVPSYLFANNAPIRIVIDGEEVISDTAPIVNSGRVLVPVRVVSESLGYYVFWDAKKRQVSITRDGTSILFNINEPKIWVNGVGSTIDVIPKIQNGRVFLPIRAISESIGALIDWDGGTRSVYIKTRSVKSSSLQVVESSRIVQLVQEDSSSLSLTFRGEGPWEPTIFRLKNPDRLVIDFDHMLLTEDLTLQHRAFLEQEQQVVEEKLTPETETDMEETTTPKDSQAGTEANAISGEGDLVDKPSTEENATSEEPKATEENVTSDSTNADTADTADTTVPEAVIQPELIYDGMIKDIRFSQFELDPDKVRIVVDLEEMADFSYTMNNDKMTISLVPHIYQIVIDAGHGGTYPTGDTGAVSINGRFEKDLNLAVALKVEKLLKNIPNAKVTMTRDADYFVTLNNRVDIANAIDADVFVSIHANALPYRPSISGTETYYTRDDSRDFARIMHNYVLNGTGFSDRGIKTADFRVTKYTSMPAVLLELGYLTNAGDEKAMYSSSFQDRVALAIANGIKNYLNLE